MQREPEMIEGRRRKLNRRSNLWWSKKLVTSFAPRLGPQELVMETAPGQLQDQFNQWNQRIGNDIGLQGKEHHDRMSFKTKGQLNLVRSLLQTSRASSG